jgi:hypothetical protein
MSETMSPCCVAIAESFCPVIPDRASREMVFPWVSATAETSWPKLAGAGLIWVIPMLAAPWACGWTTGWVTAWTGGTAPGCAIAWPAKPLIIAPIIATERSAAGSSPVRVPGRSVFIMRSSFTVSLGSYEDFRRGEFLFPF